jgi:hypothetical protein
MLFIECQGKLNDCVTTALRGDSDPAVPCMVVPAPPYGRSHHARCLEAMAQANFSAHVLFKVLLLRFSALNLSLARYGGLISAINKFAKAAHR